ncbi:MAG: DMT family transporter [Pseudomonadota bacterium]
MSANLKGSLLGLAAFGLFALHDVGIKYLGGQYSAFQIVFFIVLFGFPVLSFLLITDQTERNLRPVHPYWTAARTLAAIATSLSAFYAFSVLPLAQVYVFLFAGPLLITILAIPVLGETVGWRRACAVICGLGGVVVVLNPTETDLNQGHLAAALATICGSFAAVVMRKIGRDERSVVLMLFPMLGNFVLMGLALPFVYVPMPLIDLGAVALVSVLALMATGCLILAYRAAAAIQVAPMQYSQIIWASLFGVLIFEEAITVQTIVGGAIIVAAGLYIALREERGGTSRTQPVLSTKSRDAAPAAPRISTLLRRAPKPSPDDTL